MYRCPIAEVSKVPDVRLGWTWFEEDFVQRYSVILEGWTAGTIVDPSKLSTSQTVIRRLLDAVRAGECAQVDDEEEQSDREPDENDPPRPDDVADGADDRVAPPPPQKRARKTPAQPRTTAATMKRTTNPPHAKKAAPAKRSTAASAARDNATTRAVLERLKAGVRERKVTSHAIITDSDDEHGNDDGEGRHCGYGGGQAAAMLAIRQRSRCDSGSSGIRVMGGMRTGREVPDMAGVMGRRALMDHWNLPSTFCDSLSA
ncbi:hypothetical protein B0H14DRAFT_2589496 [Mycena olivaceomarginata]|nr:hypothetical protein B0H14DRAFT_2589496 [Mycena olivaceomarginata]